MIIYYQKKSVPLFHRIEYLTNLFNIFTLKNDLHTFVEKCCESHLHTSMGQIAQDAWIRGWGGVNLIKAMPEFWEHLFLAPLP